MNTETENGNDKLTDETRGNLKALSKAMLQLHKTLLDAAKNDYEAQNGKIAVASVESGRQNEPQDDVSCPLKIAARPTPG